jgi:hypothetical protein
MPLHSDWLPVATPHDPAEDPPGSIDPLGTFVQAERLAEILLPGFTARMWRGRLLTITTLAAHVADCVVIRINRDDVRLEARLAFERLLVSAIVRKADLCGTEALTGTAFHVRKSYSRQNPLSAKTGVSNRSQR